MKYKCWKCGEIGKSGTFQGLSPEMDRKVCNGNINIDEHCFSNYDKERNIRTGKPVLFVCFDCQMRDEYEAKKFVWQVMNR